MLARSPDNKIWIRNSRSHQIAVKVRNAQSFEFFRPVGIRRKFKYKFLCGLKYIPLTTIAQEDYQSQGVVLS